MFDQGNRMRSATGKATYGYDGLGHRMTVVGTDGVNRVQVYSQGGQLLYIAPSGGTATKYIYLHNHVLAEVNGATITYDHTDALGSPVAQSNAAGSILTRTLYEPYGYIAVGSPRTIGFTGHVNDNDTGLVYMQQRYYDSFAGRMLSIDPVTTDANTGGSFNRYAYANNSPYKYVDPDGRNPALAACAAGPVGCAVGVGLTAITAYQVWKTARETSSLLQSRSEPKQSDSADTPKSDTKSGGTNSAPAIPDGLVGDQSDSRSGQSGKRHTSGALTPENGGTGDAQMDFDHLTGGTGQPATTPNTYPPGTQVGANGIIIRPGRTGTSIDIPANGSKPPETLHYPDVK